MKIVHIFLLTTLVTISAETVPEKQKHNLLLGRSRSSEDEQLTWNQLLANVFTQKMKTYMFQDTSEKSNLTTIMSPLSDFFSNTFSVYKNMIFDKIGLQKQATTTTKMKTSKNRTNNDTDTSHIMTTTLPTSTVVPKRNRTSIYEKISIIPFVNSSGPKSEVELVEPKYHGKIQSTTPDPYDEEIVLCPEGMVLVENECMVNSKLLFAIPGQCPLGYKRDRLGFCRLWF